YGSCCGRRINGSLNRACPILCNTLNHFASSQPEVGFENWLDVLFNVFPGNLAGGLLDFLLLVCWSAPFVASGTALAELIPLLKAHRQFARLFPRFTITYRRLHLHNIIQNGASSCETVHSHIVLKQDVDTFIIPKFRFETLLVFRVRKWTGAATAAESN